MKLIGRGSVLLLILLGAACRGPTAEDRDNRRVLDEILTAITIKNPRLLEAAAERAKTRHDAGQLSDDDFQAMQSFIDAGRHGDWSAAETAGYVFRKQRPFVRGGQ